MADFGASQLLWEVWFQDRSNSLENMHPSLHNHRFRMPSYVSSVLRDFCCCSDKCFYCTNPDTLLPFYTRGSETRKIRALGFWRGLFASSAVFQKISHQNPVVSNWFLYTLSSLQEFDEKGQEKRGLFLSSARSSKRTKSEHSLGRNSESCQVQPRPRTPIPPSNIPPNNLLTSLLEPVTPCISSVACKAEQDVPLKKHFNFCEIHLPREVLREGDDEHHDLPKSSGPVSQEQRGSALLRLLPAGMRPGLERSDVTLPLHLPPPVRAWSACVCVCILSAWGSRAPPPGGAGRTGRWLLLFHLDRARCVSSSLTHSPRGRQQAFPNTRGHTYPAIHTA